MLTMSLINHLLSLIYYEDLKRFSMNKLIEEMTQYIRITI